MQPSNIFNSKVFLSDQSRESGANLRRLSLLILKTVTIPPAKQNHDYGVQNNYFSSRFVWISNAGSYLEGKS
jgi:hypothetical protein